MRALVVEHDPMSTPGRVGEYLEQAGLRLVPWIVVRDINDPEVSVVFPDEEAYDLVVLMGAPWSVYDPRLRDWVGPELEFLRRRLDRDAPTLGICFGAQAISTALGGKVAPGRAEYGWGQIEPRTPEIPPAPWFQFHHDEFTTPPGAMELAANGSGVQAFRRGRTLAVQFHPEITSDLLTSWCEAGGDQPLLDAGLDPASVIDETKAMEAESQPALSRLLDWFLDQVAGGDSWSGS